MSRSEIRAHTGMRGIAALLVVGHHYNQNLEPVLGGGAIDHFLSRQGSFVDLFFMLSGFIMMLSYRSWFAERLSRGAVGQFLLRRFARIYALHLLTLLWMTALLAHSGALPAASDVAENLMLVHAWGMNETYGLNFPSWSISAEFFLYLCCPLFVLLAARRACCVGLGMVVLGCYLWLFLLGQGLELDEQRSLMRAIPAFLTGILLAEYRDSLPKMSDRTLGLAQFVSAGTILAGLLQPALEPLLVVAFAAMIVTSWQDRGWGARLLGMRGIYWLGLVSYSLYLLHVPVRQTAYIVFPKVLDIADPAVHAIVFTLACTLATLLLSQVSYQWFETPMRRAISGLGKTHALSVASTFKP